MADYQNTQGPQSGMNLISTIQTPRMTFLQKTSTDAKAKLHFSIPDIP